MKLEGQVRIPSGCAISAVISREGTRMSGEAVIKSMIPMHDRSNGLGGGFAAYGIYPEHREEYAFHIFFDDNTTRRECEALLKESFEIVEAELIPIRIIPEITDIPHIWRYFVRPLGSVLARLQLDEKEFVVRTVMDINTRLKGENPTIINTNLSVGELGKRYGERFCSRIIGAYTLLAFAGKDVRQQKRLRRIEKRAAEHP